MKSLSKLNGLIKEIKLYSGNNEVKFITKLIELMNKIDLKNLCMLIIDLVINSCKQNLVDTDVVINYFLSSINSNSIKYLFNFHFQIIKVQFKNVYISSSGILLRGLTMLILSKKNKCYSLRNPTHPYILILRNSSENSETLNQLICQEIKFIYENNK